MGAEWGGGGGGGAGGQQQLEAFGLCKIPLLDPGQKFKLGESWQLLQRNRVGRLPPALHKAVLTSCLCLCCLLRLGRILD